MKKEEIMKNVSTTFSKVSVKLKKHSPEILVVAGVVGTVASAVMACHATTKLDSVLEKSKKDVDAIHKCAENEELAAEYSKDDAKKDLTIVYVQAGVKVAKLYAPAVALGTLSIASIVASHNILKKRNVALAAAYATVDKTFKEYRNRVVERFGAEVDKELRYNIKAKKFEETVTDPDSGKEKKVKSKTSVSAGRSLRYAEVGTLENVKILADTSSVEVFVNDGEFVFSTRYYPNDYKIVVHSPSAHITFDKIQ